MLQCRASGMPSRKRCGSGSFTLYARLGCDDVTSPTDAKPTVLRRGALCGAPSLGEQAVPGFFAKAVVEVVAFGTAWSRTEHVAVVPADSAVEKLLPLHIRLVA